MWPSQTAGPQAEMTMLRAQLREKRITDRIYCHQGPKFALGGLYRQSALVSLPEGQRENTDTSRQGIPAKCRQGGTGQG